MNIVQQFEYNNSNDYELIINELIISLVASVIDKYYSLLPWQLSVYQSVY